MDTTSLISFIFVTILLVISPGPNGVLIAKTTALHGKKSGIANIFGFIAAFYIHGTLSILGISALLVQSSNAFFIFKLLGAAYLCWIGIKSLIDTWRTSPEKSTPTINRTERRTSLGGAFFEGFITNALNPKVSMFYLAAFPQFINLGESISQAYVLVTVHATINLMWFYGMILFLSKLKNVSHQSKFSKRLKQITGIVFIGFGAKLAFLKPLSDT